LAARRLRPHRSLRSRDEVAPFHLVTSTGRRVGVGAWRRIALSDLVDEPWALPPPDSMIGSLAREAFRASGVDYPRTTVVTYSAHMRLGLLTTGRFLTIQPASLLRFPTKRLELKVLPVVLPLAREPIGIITLQNRTLSPTARLFIDTAREIAKPLAKRK
jgi:DNA-binding transcriptional LysR family regulator